MAQRHPPGPAMTLGNMRELGVRGSIACEGRTMTKTPKIDHMAPMTRPQGATVPAVERHPITRTPYTDRSARSGEYLIHQARLHPIIFAPAIFLAVAGVLIVGASAGLGLILIALAILKFLAKVVEQSTTEIAVTSERIVYKIGLIRRATSEMNIRKVESVLISQSVLGRMFGYGTLVVRGTGQGIEPLRKVASPLALRRSILEASGHE